MAMQTYTGAELWGDPTRTNLVASGGTATEITFGTNVEFVYVTAGGEWKWLFATSAANAATAFTAGTAVGVVPAGFLPIPVRGRNGKNLYILSTGSAVANGLSYWKASLTTPAPS